MAQGISNRYAGLKSKRFVSPAQVETRVDDDDVFTEGPAVDREGIVYFTNIPVSQILKWDPRTKKLAVFRTDSHQTNGLLFDCHGNLLACESGAGHITRPGIHVISPDGRLLAYAETPEDTITNCTFGGKDLRTLYVTCGHFLLSLRTEIPGKPAYRPEA